MQTHLHKLHVCTVLLKFTIGKSEYKSMSHSVHDFEYLSFQNTLYIYRITLRLRYVY